MFKQSKIPTILALFLLVLGTGVGVYLVKSPPAFFSKAAPGAIPTQVKITNVADTGFVVSWVTDAEVTGFVKFGETTSLEQTMADSRDLSTGKTGAFKTHYVALKNLKPNTKYYLKIGSETKIYDNSGKPYEITTAATLTSPPVADPAYGTILDASGNPADGAIVYLSLANTTPQSCLVSTSGNWLVSLNSARSQSLASWASYDPEASTIEILVQGKGQTATATTTTKNDNPVPTITLGKTYDFRQNAPKETTTTLSPTPSSGQTDQETPSSKFSFTDLGLPKEATGSSNVVILNPSEDEKITSQKPEIMGTGPAGKTLQIVIESPVAYTGTAKTDSKGNWVFTPPQNLTPGEHTIKVTLAGKTIFRTFTVLAAGESSLPAFTATPSASITPKPTATPSVKMTPTPTPTKVLSPTPTATGSGRTSMPATTGGVPRSGDLTPTLFIFIMGLGLVFCGLVLGQWVNSAYER